MSNFVLTPNAVAKLRRAIAPRSGNTGAVAATGVPIDPDKFPPPFTVRWSASEWWAGESSPGSWVIWLPNPQKIVWYNGKYIPPHEGLGTVTVHGQTYRNSTIIPAEYLPAGWYRMGRTPPSTTAVRIVIREQYWMFINDTSTTSYPQLYIAEVGYENGRATVKQIIDSAITLDDSSGGSVVPDNISTEFIPDQPSGTTPDGDEGELQIKGFKAGTPADQNTLPDYLQGVANIPSGGISLVCRGVDTNGARQLSYLPLAALFSGSSISGNVSLSFVGDIRWDLSSHTLQKRVDSVNLKTGAVTQGQWETITNGATTGISTIIGS